MRTSSTVGQTSRASVSPAVRPSSPSAATMSRQAWRTNFGPRSFQSLTSWKWYQFGRTNGSSPGPPTSCGTVPPTLRGARATGRLDRDDLRVVDRDRREEVADPADLELGEQLEHRERGVEVDVDGVVERVVHALEEGEPADVVRRRIRAADLAVLPERATVDEEVELVEERHHVPVGAIGIGEVRRLPGLDGGPPRGRLGERVPSEVHGPLAGPAPVLRVALPPASTGPELDLGEVPGEGEPDGAALAGGEGQGGRERRSAGRGGGGIRKIDRRGVQVGQATVGGEIRPELVVVDGVEPRARGERRARRPRGPRSRGSRGVPPARRPRHRRRRR